MRKRRPKQYPVMKKPQADCGEAVEGQGLGGLTNSELDMWIRSYFDKTGRGMECGY